MPQTLNRAKSKQNSQRVKETPKQGVNPVVAANPKPAAATTAPVTVPQSQPAKPNNKSNKMKELNMKGATKEGTDMDAFSDNADALNANTTFVAAPETNVTNAAPVNANTINDSNKKIETNETPTIKPEIKTLPKKIDVTDIVKEKPKPFVAPPPAPVETKDEPDRAFTSNDKLVQAKNEANAKTINENDEISDFKSPLPYKEDQWSPMNKDGKKIYDREFLMLLKSFPKSKLKPENILNEIVAQGDNRVGDVSRYAISGGGGGRTDFAPSFGGGGGGGGFGKSQSQRGVATKRGSQQGKIGGNSKSGKSGSVIRVSISFKEDVKLHETENAWKPARLFGNAQSDDDKKTAELYKKVRGVLNKLTPQKFNTLLNQIKTLPIDTSERLQGVIDLVFEKAVDEPNFSVAYALMCRELALMQVPIGPESKEFVNFRKLLVTRCQLEFEKNSNEEGNRQAKLQEIETCTDPEKKKELYINLDEDERRIRMKSVGNIRFIGELFKQQMLTVKIMVRCLHNLLENKDEERLECLCKLLTTIGKELETKKVDLQPIFGTMKDIVEKKNGKVSSRVRFMLQDVIDLRSGHWVPRRQDLNPKTIDQIQKEADSEQLNIQVMNSGPITPRKDDRNSNSNQDRNKRGGRNVSNDEGGWSTAPTRGNKTTPITFHRDKLKINQAKDDEPLGSTQMYGNWSRGSNFKPSTNTANMYAALEKMNDDNNRSMGGRPGHKEPYSSKGSSLERNYKQYESGRGSRSGSQHRSNESSQRSTPTPIQQIQTPKVPPPPTIDHTSDAFVRHVKNILEEYLNDCSNIKETCSEIKTSMSSSPAALEQFVIELCNEVVDRSRTARLKTGQLFNLLMAQKILSIDILCQALEKVFSYSEDLLVDIPSLWQCYTELIFSLVNEKQLPLKHLHKCSEFLISTKHAHKLMASLFKLLIEESGPNQLTSIWKSSGLNFHDFMPANQIESFILDNHLEFLNGSSEEGQVQSTFGCSSLSYSQIHDKLMQFLKTQTTFDNIIHWVTTNVSDKMKEIEFIRVLATVVIEQSIIDFKLNEESLRENYPLLTRFIDSNSDFELQCLYAIQAIMNKLDHPQGLLLKIFNTLYEDTIISHDSFITWEKSDDPAGQVKKGVAVKQLTSFFTQLKENDDEESGSSVSEDA